MVGFAWAVLISVQAGAVVVPQAPIWLEVIPGKDLQIVLHPRSPSVDIETVGIIDLVKPVEGRVDRTNPLWETARGTMVGPLRTEKIGKAWRVWFAPPHVYERTPHIVVQLETGQQWWFPLRLARGTRIGREPGQRGKPGAPLQENRASTRLQ